jgi:hypothetical protein
MADSGADLRLFGLAVKREANVLSLVAFLMSMASLSLQGWDYLRGPVVSMTAGERVNLFRLDDPSAMSPPFLAINARMNYVNTGAMGRDAIIESERVRFALDGGLWIEYRWLHFEMLVPTVGGGFERKVKDGAHAFVAPGAGAASHQTTFVGFPEAPDPADVQAVSTVMTWDSLMAQLETGAGMALRFVAADAAGKEHAYACDVLLNDSVLNALRRDGWATALCLQG